MAKKLKPIHPGEILREEYMIPLGLSSNALARAIDVTPARVNEIVRERRGISADTALRLARFFKTDAQSWLNLQTNYDMQCAEDAAGSAIAKIKPLMQTAVAA
ncbi:HigA family addiction module antitoxin [Solimonas marina]|uniref:HigA family addiction module antidote protein n=1 Tax=Solimonas marina TaxID=2714601 RepID=A0A969WBQ3_9GAMM|nr:HigA family addiction module antitoxin [Solimonas marina]NKF23239.1 HigA family addiction module antidote protein [Solimonas marina]